MDPVRRLLGEYQKRSLDPIDRFSEIIFGLIMVLAFTGAFSVAQSGRQEVRQMLVAALTCNVAWGLVDGVMYLLTAIAERARRTLIYRGFRAADPASARTIVLAALPEGIGAITHAAEADRMAARIRALPEPPYRPPVSMRDLRGALASGLLVVLATLPPSSRSCSSARGARPPDLERGGGGDPLPGGLLPGVGDRRPAGAARPRDGRPGKLARA